MDKCVLNGKRPAILSLLAQQAALGLEIFSPG